MSVGGCCVLCLATGFGLRAGCAGRDNQLRVFCWRFFAPSVLAELVLIAAILFYTQRNWGDHLDETLKHVNLCV